MLDGVLEFKYIYVLCMSVLVVIIFLINIRNKKVFKKDILDKVTLFKNLFNHLDTNILMLSGKNEILYANKAAVKFFSLNKDFINTNINIPSIKVKDKWLDLDKFIKNTKMKSENSMFVLGNTSMKLGDSKDSVEVNIYFSKSNIDIINNKPCTLISIDELKKENEQALNEFKHKLTKLPNQTQVLIDLNALYARQHLNENKITMAIINIDNFSTLRSIVGYEQSNRILITFADYLCKLSKKFSFKVYHTEHNNFLLVMTNVNSESDVTEITEIIQKELMSFYTMGNNSLHLTASIGVSIYPDSSSKLTLFDDAYKALSAAEKNGFGKVEFFKQNSGKHDYDQLKLYNELHKALEEKEFEIYYQPIVDAQTKKTMAAEALVRWIHPEHGLIAPYVFIPIMERTGLIVELGKYMLEGVLKQQKLWENFKFRQVEVSINLSMLEFETGEFVDHVKSRLEAHKVSSRLIKFEITEGIAMINEDKTSQQLNGIRDLGINISLDDFGTGYTSFSYLKKIPANTLKIDRSLIINIVKNKDDQRIVKGIIDLGHTLGMKIVVEGIETKSMYEKIAEMGGDYIQGYYFSKPIPAFEFQELLR